MLGPLSHLESRIQDYAAEPRDEVKGLADSLIILSLEKLPF
jgi:hypothetical protein